MQKHYLLPILMVVALFMSVQPVAAANKVTGKLTVAGKTHEIKYGYAYAQAGFFDEAKDDVVVVLCDAAIPEAAQRDMSERRQLIQAGKLHCVQHTINASQKVINYRVQHQAFGMPETGSGTEHVFESKLMEPKKIAGRSYTKSPRKSFKDIPYTYNIEYELDISPKK